MLAARRRRLVALGAIATIAASAATIAVDVGAGLSPAEPSVVVRDRDGATVARLPLPADGRFALAYRHSYYRVAAEERFVRDDPGFRLDAIASPRSAVLDYYALDGRRTRDGAWLTLRPRRTPPRRRLALIATAVGRRTLVVGSRRVALYGAQPRHLIIAVEDR